MAGGDDTVPSDLDAPETIDTMLRKVARAPAVAPGATAGDVIDGTFRIERRLGAGGMGEVFLARDLRLQRLVALKLHDGREGLAERSRREAKLMAQHSHPHDATIH
jgi:serine/threonine protein kinase